MAFEIRRLKTLHALLGIVFLLSGLIVNFFQLIFWWLLRPRSPSFYRKINYYLTYTVWSQVLALAEYWSNSTCTVYSDNVETFENFGKEHCLCVMNHKFDIDWINAWMVADKYRVLGGCKSITKKSLKWVPVIGWGWYFGEFIFLNRNLEKDRDIIRTGVETMMEYEDTIILLLFCEGTRFTKEKHEASMKVAKEKGLAPLKHHLLPRTKGFALCVEKMKEIDPNCALYNIQVGFPEGADDHQPTLSNMVKGRPIHGHMYFDRIPIRDIPTDSEESVNSFLYDLYQKKDKLMDYYCAHGKFPGVAMDLKRRKTPFINWILWFIPISSLAVTSLWCLITSRNGYLVSLGVALLTLGCTMIYVFIRLTKSSKGSSYGKVVTNESKTPTNEEAAEKRSESQELRQRKTPTNGGGSATKASATDTD